MGGVVRIWTQPYTLFGHALPLALAKLAGGVGKAFAVSLGNFALEARLGVTFTFQRGKLIIGEHAFITLRARDGAVAVSEDFGTRAGRDRAGLDGRVVTVKSSNVGMVVVSENTFTSGSIGTSGPFGLHITFVMIGTHLLRSTTTITT